MAVKQLESRCIILPGGGGFCPTGTRLLREAPPPSIRSSIDDDLMVGFGRAISLDERRRIASRVKSRKYTYWLTRKKRGLK